MPRRVIILGAGSHGRLLLEQLETDPDVEVVGFMDPDPDLQNNQFRGYEVLGGDDDVPALWDRDVFDVGVVGVGDSNLQVRSELRRLLEERNIPLLSFVHDSAEAAGSARIGAGSVVMPQSYVGTDAILGANVVVYTSVTIEHETTIGDDAYVAPGAVLCGEVSIGETALVGANATVLPGCSVGAGAVIGAGSVVTGDVGPNQQVSGVPAKPPE